MPKSGQQLTETERNKAREIHRQILDENPDFKAIVDHHTRGKTGREEQKAWSDAVNQILRNNPLYREKVKAKFDEAGIPTQQI